MKSGLSIEELARDIERRGLLQSLSVRPVLDGEGTETGTYEVPAGGRRFRALELLVKQKKLAKTAPVPCVVREAGSTNAERLTLTVPGQNDPIVPTHWSFGQMCSLVGAPSSYLRNLPAPLAAINLQHGLLSHRAELVKTLETRTAASNCVP
ncbi:hypothetical protein SXCC_04362 [Gluconacetobacter sp. SXCC-1]|nr:hypothetical protein SXCC_04362 [Gluconacetobacter sp. SXCC-1]